MTALPAARMEFAPPPTPGLVRALALAIAAHALLLLALGVGVQWRHEAPSVTVEAELWASVPQQAAPPAPDPEPPLPPADPVKPPKPLVPPADPVPDPSIAVAKEKARLQKIKEKEKQLQLEKLEDEKRLKAKKLQDAKDARDKAARDKLAQAQNSKTSTAEQKKLDDIRKQQIARMAGLAAGTGEAGSTGTAAQSAGPSAGYAGRIRARIKPNITYTETIAGNPAAEIEVRTSPDGTIISRKLVKPSGVKSWDDAVLSAIDKTETLPRDVDGRVPPVLTLVFRPKD